MFDGQKYNYSLPENLLAQKPVVPRDSSRLFIYNTENNTVSFDRFINLDQYLPRDSFIVLNNTKVLPARVVLKKQTGGRVVCLLLINELLSFAKVSKDEHDSRIIRVMVDRKVNVGDKLFFDKDHFFEAVSQKEHIFELKYRFSYSWLLLKLQEIGQTPVPLYLRKTPLQEGELRKKYQTIFAKDSSSEWNLGSVAAPTASLHFSNRVFKKLGKAGIKKYFVTLHVGMGTFAPVTEKNIKTKKLHEEYFTVDKKTLQCFKTSKSAGKKLIAVGTTVTRTLESISKIKNQRSKMHIVNNIFFGKTDLFIMPPYDFQMVDCLITNFHLPKSSLIMLVEAFLQYKSAKRSLMDLYKIAIKEKFRFYSFGDAMLII